MSDEERRFGPGGRRGRIIDSEDTKQCPRCGIRHPLWQWIRDEDDVRRGDSLVQIVWSSPDARTCLDCEGKPPIDPFERLRITNGAKLRYSWDQALKWLGLREKGLAWKDIAMLYRKAHSDSRLMGPTVARYANLARDLQQAEVFVGEPAHKHSPRKYENLHDSVVNRWARWRREGRSYAWIGRHEPSCSPSRKAIKRLLKDRGYDPYTGEPLEE